MEKRGGGRDNLSWTEEIFITLRWFEYNLFITQKCIWTPRLTMHNIVNKLLGALGSLQPTYSR